MTSFLRTPDNTTVDWDTSPRTTSGEKERADATDRTIVLARTIETEIIPRLLMASGQVQARAPAPLPPARTGISDSEVNHFAKAIVQGDSLAALRRVNNLRERGVSLEEVFIDLLAPTARHLGEAWKDDTLTFVDVTIGLSRLQQVLRHLSPIFERRASDAGDSHRMLLLPMPGEQHTFGTFIVEVFFRHSGWQVLGADGMSMSEALDSVRSEWFDAIGLSIGCEGSLAELAAHITKLRRKSQNKHILVMVGGPAFSGHPERVTQVGADATAADGRDAVRIAKEWLANRAAL